MCFLCQGYSWLTFHTHWDCHLLATQCMTVIELGFCNPRSLWLRYISEIVYNLVATGYVDDVPAEKGTQYACMVPLCNLCTDLARR